MTGLSVEEVIKMEIIVIQIRVLLNYFVFTYMQVISKFTADELTEIWNIKK